MYLPTLNAPTSSAQAPLAPREVLACAELLPSLDLEHHLHHSGFAASPLPTHPSAPHFLVCIQHVPACARKAKAPTKLFSLSSFQKNGPIHSCNPWEDFLSGSLEANCQEQKAAASQRPLLSLAQTTIKTTSNTTKQATCAQAPTNTPTEPKQTARD